MRIDREPTGAWADDRVRSRASGRSSCVQCRARGGRSIVASRACGPIGSTMNDPPPRGGRHRRASAEIVSSAGTIVGADFASCVAEAAQLRIFSAAAFGRSRYPCVARRRDWPCRRRAALGQCRRSLCRKSLQRSVLSVQRSQKLTRCSGHESLCRSASGAEVPSRQPSANRMPSLRPTRRKIASQRGRLQDTVRACSPFVPYARSSLGAKNDDFVLGRGWRTFTRVGRGRWSCSNGRIWAWRAGQNPPRGENARRTDAALPRRSGRDSSQACCRSDAGGGAHERLIDRGPRACRQGGRGVFSPVRNHWPHSPSPGGEGGRDDSLLEACTSFLDGEDAAACVMREAQVETRFKVRAPGPTTSMVGRPRGRSSWSARGIEDGHRPCYGRCRSLRRLFRVHEVTGLQSTRYAS